MGTIPAKAAEPVRKARTIGQAPLEKSRRLPVLTEVAKLLNQVPIRGIDVHLPLYFVPRIHDRRAVPFLKVSGDSR